MKEALSQDNKFLMIFIEQKIIVKKLGLSYKKINCYLNGCMLYYKDGEKMTQCKFRHSP